MANDEDVARLRQGVAWNDWRAQKQRMACGSRTIQMVELGGVNLKGVQQEGLNADKGSARACRPANHSGTRVCRGRASRPLHGVPG